MKRSKALALLIANRVQHRTWVLTQRKAVAARQRSLSPGEYGTIYDSAGQHVDIWCATLTWVDNGAEQQHHVAMFYDKEQVNGEKNKNSNTGMMALRRLVDPALNGGTSLLHTLFHPRPDWSSLGTREMASAVFQWPGFTAPSLACTTWKSSKFLCRPDTRTTQVTA